MFTRILLETPSRLQTRLPLELHEFVAPVCDEYSRVRLRICFLDRGLKYCTNYTRFALGVLVFEHVSSFLGRFRFASPVCLRRGKNVQTGQLDVIGTTFECKSRSRHLSLVLASALHACFFILLGTSRSFVNILLGYSVAAFARAFLTGESPPRDSSVRRELIALTVRPYVREFYYPGGYASADLKRRNAYIASTPKRPLGQLHASWGELMETCHCPASYTRQLSGHLSPPSFARRSLPREYGGSCSISVLSAYQQRTRQFLPLLIVLRRVKLFTESQKSKLKSIGS